MIDDSKLLMELKTVPSKLVNFVLILQPYLTFPVFLSILLGTPPTWLSWLIAIIPLPVRFFLTRRLTYRTPFDLPIVISIAGMIVGFFICPDRQQGLQFLQTYLACVLLYYGFVNNRNAKTWYWISISVFVCIILIFLSVWTFGGGKGKHVVFNLWAYQLVYGLPPLLGTTVHTNAIGGALAVIIPGLLGITLASQRTGIRWGAGILGLFFGAILVLSASSGSWIATIAGILVIFVFHKNRMYLSAFTILGLLIGITFPFWRNFSWVEIVFPIESLLNRFEMWHITIIAIGNNWFTGLGLGSWLPQISTYAPLGGPHSAYIQLYSDSGVIGIIALIIAAILFTRMLFQIMRSDENNRYFAITLGIGAGIISGGIYAIIELNANIFVSLGDRFLYFAVPLIWLWLSLFVVSYWRLTGKIPNSESFNRNKNPV